MKEKCDVCGHETSYLEAGIGEYEGKKLCKLCDSRIHEIRGLKGEISKLKDDRAALVLAAGKCVASIDTEVSMGLCNATYSLIRNTLNGVLEDLGIEM